MDNQEYEWAVKVESESQTVRKSNWVIVTAPSHDEALDMARDKSSFNRPYVAEIDGGYAIGELTDDTS